MREREVNVQNTLNFNEKYSNPIKNLSQQPSLKHLPPSLTNPLSLFLQLRCYQPCGTSYVARSKNKIREKQRKTETQ